MSIRLEGVALLVVLLVTFAAGVAFALFGPFTGGVIDTVLADSLRADVAAAERQRDSVVALFLSRLRDAHRGRDSAIRETDRKLAEAAADRLASERAERLAAERAETLRDGLVASGVCAELCPKLDALNEANAEALAAERSSSSAKDSVINSLRESEERAWALLGEAEDALVAEQGVSAATAAERDFWRSEAERLAAEPRFSVDLKTPLVIPLALVGGYTFRALTSKG